MSGPEIRNDNKPVGAGELARFTRLFDQLVQASILWLEKTPPDRLEWTPPTDRGLHFGTRLR